MGMALTSKEKWDRAVALSLHGIVFLLGIMTGNFFYLVFVLGSVFPTWLIIANRSKSMIVGGVLCAATLVWLPLTMPSSANACTRVLWNDNSIAVLSGRSADWFKASKPKGATDPKLLVMPRGLLKSGAKFGNEVVVTENPATWRSRYGSVVVSTQNTTVFDGMNEKGLAAHSLSLPVTNYGVRDVSRQGIHMGLWVPYILDNAATVPEAIALLAGIQPVQVVVDNFPMKLSLSIEDRFGDSAVIEYLDGVAVIRHSRQLRVMANTELTVAEKELGKYNFNFQEATRNVPLPGNANSVDRFVRASFFSGFLSNMEARNLTEARAALMSVVRNVSNPIGAPGDTPGQGPFSGDETDWRTLSDLTNRVYIFDNPRTLAIMSTDLRSLNFGRVTGVRVLDPGNPRLHGDITRLYRPSRVAVPGVVSR
jgi:penicillin V acylase-like amidase (Ntn superfamily)